MKVGGLTSIFQVCRVNFIVSWGPGKFGLKRLLGVTNEFELILIFGGGRQETKLLKDFLTDLKI